MFGIALSLALTGGASLGAVTGAGAADRGTIPLELGYDRERPVELPVPAPDVDADTNQAIKEIESRRKAGSTARQDQGGPSRRPDLDHDVTQGIQSRELNRAMGR